MRFFDWFVPQRSTTEEMEAARKPISDPTVPTDRVEWLKALEVMRVEAPQSYEYTVEYLKTQLYQARHVKLWDATMPRDMICNAEIARDAKIRTLEDLVFDMSNTTTSLVEDEDVYEDPEPASILAGS